MSISLLCVAFLVLLCIGLGFNVSLVRGKTKIMYGGEVDPEAALYKAQRAHGNTIEYAPAVALLIYILGQSVQPTWVIWCMVLVTLFRYSAAAGILFPKSMATPHPMRFIGSLGTYIGGLALVVALMIQAMNL